MTHTVLRGVPDAPALVAAVAAALPSWPSYFAFDGEPHARPLQVSTVTIPADAVDAALTALRELPDELAEAAYATAGWREADLVATLRAWGWAAEELAGTARLGGIWGDVVFPATFAALAAVAPHVRRAAEPAWVFGADRDDEPVFAVEFTDAAVTFTHNVELVYVLD